MVGSLAQNCLKTALFDREDCSEKMGTKTWSLIASIKWVIKVLMQWQTQGILCKLIKSKLFTMLAPSSVHANFILPDIP